VERKIKGEPCLRACGMESDVRSLASGPALALAHLVSRGTQLLWRLPRRWVGYALVP